MKQFFKFIWAQIVSFLPGATGIMFTPSGNNSAWYNALHKSALTPAGWFFGAAWTVLYFLLGWALYLIMKNSRPWQQKIRAYTLFGIHLFLNALWTYWFFGAHLMDISLVVLAVLLGVAIWMMRVFRTIDRRAGNLVWPYIIWLGFALYLNGAIVYMN
ncbi:tryptophan-rich sensory protein [bacterium]|nr:tryptophan-rich sensory protein [bacterium]